MKHERIEASLDSKGPDGRAARRPVEFRAHLVLAGGRVLDVELTDLSYEGASAKCPDYLFPGDPVRLSLMGRGALDAEVRWCRDGMVGLKFKGVTPEPEAPKEVPRNGDRRVSACEAQLRRLGNPTFSVGVRDVSPTGCKVDLVERPSVGEVMQIKLPGLEALDARVAWIEGYIAGLKFDRAIHPAVFDMLMTRIGADG